MCKVLNIILVLVAAGLVDSRAAGPLLSPAGNVYKPTAGAPPLHQEHPVFPADVQPIQNDNPVGPPRQLPNVEPGDFNASIEKQYRAINAGVENQRGNFNAGVEEQRRDVNAGIARQQQRSALQELRQIANVHEDGGTIINPYSVPMSSGQLNTEIKSFTQQGPQMQRENRQFSNMLENPILTYLLHQQKQDSSKKEPEESGNIRRKITHQQTIISPSPQFLQQLQQPSVQYQYPTGQQSNLPAPPPGLAQQLMPILQQQLSTSGDSQRNELQQPSTGENYVTTLTLYPAIASVLFTHPAPSSTNYYPTPAPPTTTYPQAPSLDLQSYKSLGPAMSYPARMSWPFAEYFPIVIKDPFMQIMNAVTSMVEYGPEADVCRKDKADRQGRSELPISESPTVMYNPQGWKLFVNGEENIATDNEKLVVEAKSSKSQDSSEKAIEGPEARSQEGEGNNQETEVVMESEGKGTSGPFITRLMVRKGGVSIAGPGGIATAGSGGTAIVGPGGVAYTSPNGLAVVGPGAKVVGLPNGADLSALAASAKSAAQPGPSSRWITLPPGGRLVATGPTVYFHPPETKFPLGRGWGYPAMVLSRFQATPSRVYLLPQASIRRADTYLTADHPSFSLQRWPGFLQPMYYPVIRHNSLELSTAKTTHSKVTPGLFPEVTLTVAGNGFDTVRTTQGEPVTDDLAIFKDLPMARGDKEDPKEPPTSLVLKPVAKAVAGINGTAVAAPISRAIVRKGHPVNIHFDPQAVAVVGPGGLADAHSDLFISYLDEEQQGSSGH